MNQRQTTVAIIGAGASGLVALKEMLEAGHDAIILERSSTLGGVFAGAGAHDGAPTPPPFHLTISNWFMAFSDFPDLSTSSSSHPIHPVRYPTCADYLAYLQRYAQHFQLESRIQYRTEVRSAELLERSRNTQDDGAAPKCSWRLETHDCGPEAKEQQPKIQIFDAMIVATGANLSPRKATFTSSGIERGNQVPLLNLERFDGLVLHSSEYSDEFRRQVREKQLRVLVIGTGESGADIAGDLANSTVSSNEEKDSHDADRNGNDKNKNIVVWSRSAPCVSPRYIDPTFSEQEHLVRNNRETGDDDKKGGVEGSKEAHHHHHHPYPVTSFAECFTTCRIGSGINVYFYGLFRLLLMLLGGPDPTTARWNLQATRGAPVRFDQATWVTKTALMSQAVNAGTLEVRIGGPSPPEALGGKIVRVCGESSSSSSSSSSCSATTTTTKTTTEAEKNMMATVVTEREFDAVVLCTGFESSFPWIRVPKKYHHRHHHHHHHHHHHQNGPSPPVNEEEEEENEEDDKMTTTTTPFTNTNPRDWYLHCFPPRLGHCLFFVGFARPQQGGIPPLSEILSRYIAQLLLLPHPTTTTTTIPSSCTINKNKKNKKQNTPKVQPLPTNYATLAQRHGAAERAYYSLRPDLHTLVDYNAFIESVARKLGCEPRLPFWSCLVPFNLHMLATAATAVTMSLSLLLGAQVLPFLSLFLLWALSTAAWWLLFFFFFFFFLSAAEEEGNLTTIQFLLYPNWPLWYRLRDRPDLVRDALLRRLPVSQFFDVSSPFFVVFALQSLLAFYFQRLLVSPVVFFSEAAFGGFAWLWLLLLRRGGDGGEDDDDDDEDDYYYLGWLVWMRPKQFVLHGCPWRFSDLFLP